MAVTQAYRSRPAEPDQIALIVGVPSFLRRLRATLRAGRALLLVLTIPGLMFSMVFMLVGLSIETLLWASLVVQALFLVPALIALSLRSLFPGPNEVLLPRRLLLREGVIDVAPRDGPSFEARWTYIAEARETQASFILLLCREPRLEIVVRKSALLGEQHALLSRWLREHKLLRA